MQKDDILTFTLHEIGDGFPLTSIVRFQNCSSNSTSFHLMPLAWCDWTNCFLIWSTALSIRVSRVGGSRPSGSSSAEQA